MRAFKSLFWIEFKLSIRAMNLVLFGLFSPAVVAVIIGLIYGAKPAFDGAGYSFMAQSFGALAGIGICATGLMGLPLALADYRHRKILKRFEVTPVSPGLLLFVQMVVNFVYALAATVMVYGICRGFGGAWEGGSFLYFALSFLLVTVSIYSLGMLVASVAGNIKTANLLCTILYFPMLIFSGATLPYEIMPPALQRAADIMPLTQGVKLMKNAALGLPVENAAVPIAAMVILAVVCVALSVRFFRWE